MKTLAKTLTSVFVAITFITTAQTIRVADNNPSAPAGANIFATVQEAIDAASPGDIIQVVPSATSYGDFTVNKQLRIYGVGYNPMSQLPHTSDVDIVSLEGAGASGALISGLVCLQIDLATDNGSPYILSNVTIESNSVYLIQQNTANTVQDLIIRNNIVHGNGNPARTITLAIDTKVVNAEITNNILRGASGVLAGSVSAGNFTIIRNNLFYGTNGAALPAFHQLFDCIVTNNIFYGRTPTYGTLGSMDRNVFSNNLSFNAFNNTLPPVASGIGNTGIDNIEGVDPLLTNVPFSLALWDPATYDPSLQAGSPALGAGTGGEDLGIFDGPYPFTNYMTGTVVSVIEAFNTSGLVNEGETLKVNIQASSSN